MNDVMNQAVDELLADRRDARIALANAIFVRGESPDFAREEIARVFCACMWHAWNNDPVDMDVCFQRLADGESAADIFPDQEDAA